MFVSVLPIEKVTSHHITIGILNGGHTHGFHESCALFSPGKKFKTSILTLQ